MEHTTEVISLPDGRDLEVAAFGDENGEVLVFHHGTPGSAPLAMLLEGTSIAKGRFVVTTSRAGYGRSGRHEGRRVADAVGDVRAALAHFDLANRPYVAIGWSGGGPHALAHGALDPQHCRAVISLAGVAPYDADFDWTEGMGPENIHEFELARQGGPEHEANIEQMCAAMALATPDNIVELFGGLLSPTDVAAIDEMTASVLAASTAHSASFGHYGMLDDDFAILEPWGFSLADISVPAEIIFGDEDLMVPPSHGHFLASAVPGATKVHRAPEGHVSVIKASLDDLATRVSGYLA